MGGIADPRDFRRALGAFPTGVTVVTSRDPAGQPRGFTANSFTSVSLAPPLLSVCVAESAASAAIFSAAPAFAITVLGNRQQDVSALFASKAADKFTRAAWREGALGMPLIEGGVAWFVCRREQTVRAGDHFLLLGEVVAYGHTPEEPLGYCRGAYVDFALSQSALAGLGRSVSVQALLEHDEGLVLLRLAGGALGLPAGHALGPATDPASLLGVLAGLGLPARLDFLFAVFEHAGDQRMSIVYRGSAGGDPRPPAERHPIGAVPLERVADPALRSMISRYVRERVEGFGIYVGDDSSGTVQTLMREIAP